MSSPKNLDITGNLILHPFAELLVELLQARLDGSLRLSHLNNKTIIYVKDGEVVFAVSNQRQHRIFEMLLQAEAITKQQLIEIPEFTSDFALAKVLQEKEILSASLIKSVFTHQVEAILRDVIGWTDGIWTFSSLARIKEDIHYQVDTYNLLVEYARSMPQETIVRRFKSFKESFGRKPFASSHINLLPQEAFLLSRFENSFMQIDDIKSLSGLSDLETLQKLYVLWLAGFLHRQDWDAAFNEHRLSAISSAKFEVKKQVVAPPVVKPAASEHQSTNAENSLQEKEKLTLEKYLEQVEKAETHYELLRISHKSTATEIKSAYFGLAKCFHPDLFHKQTDAKTHRRIQNAFSEIAHAYETLHDEETRQTYDFKLRKLLQELEKMGPIPEDKPVVQQKDLTEASEIFEHGFKLLMEEDHHQAMPYLARAANLAPNVARYRAYYGKILATDKTKRFKAEAELQAAIKLEAGDPTYRIMLAEFFVQYKLVKRAEGELTRLLAIFHDNKEAQALLDSLR
ncbi:MAG: DnaJ domain-containing protein [Actinomycetota bacterium]